jgi:hypothetical protein
MIFINFFRFYLAREAPKLTGSVLPKTNGFAQNRSGKSVKLIGFGQNRSGKSVKPIDLPEFHSVYRSNSNFSTFCILYSTNFIGF